jgi:hypothetical protein
MNYGTDAEQAQKQETNMRYLVNFTETETTVKAYTSQEACDAAREVMSARGTTIFVETIEDMLQVDRDHLARIYNALKVDGEPVVHSFKTRGDAADRAWDRMVRVDALATDVVVPDAPAQDVPAEVAAVATTPASTDDVATTPAPAASPVAPAAKRTGHATGKPATAEGHPIRPNTKTGRIVAYLLRGATLDEMAGSTTFPRDAIQARVWSVWASTGIGYAVSPEGVYTAVLPANLTSETVFKS